LREASPLEIWFKTHLPHHYVDFGVGGSSRCRLPFAFSEDLDILEVVEYGRIARAKRKRVETAKLIIQKNVSREDVTVG